MIGELYDTMWGDIRLWCSSMSTENGRAQVIHRPATTTSASDFEVSDRGPDPRRVVCQLLFDFMTNDSTPPLDRFKAFKAQVDSGSEEVFTHPIEGSFFVHVEAFTYEIDEDSNIASASVTFIASGLISPISPARNASAALAGDDSVITHADLLADLMADNDISSTVPVDAKAAIASWDTGDAVPTRTILQDAQALDAQITALIDGSQLDADLALWDTYQEAIQLQAAIRDAALAATSETETIFFLKVTVDVSVLALMVQVYGGAAASTKERQFRSLNDVGAMLHPGDEVAMPAVSSRRLAA